MSLPRALTFTLVATSILGASGAHAGPEYERALTAYERVEYPQTVRALESALQSESLTPTEMERAYFILGSSLLGDGQADRAERVFKTLVALHPDYKAERDASPKVLEILRRARAQVGSVPPKIVPDPRPASATGDTLTVHAEMSAAPLAPAIEYRLAGETGPGTRVRVSCQASDCEAKLPATTERYRLGFLTQEGAFALATSEVKLVSQKLFVAPRAAHTPLYKKWWLWTIVGVVVVGGVTGAVVGTTLSQRAAQSIDFSIRKDCGGTATCPLWTP